MSNKKVKCAMAAALAGTMLGGGCLFGGLPLRQILWGSAVSVGTDFLLDNDTSPLGIDLFEDGDVPVAAPAG